MSPPRVIFLELQPGYTFHHQPAGKRKSTFHQKDTDRGPGQEGGFRVYLPTFLICKDTQCRRASSVSNFKFSPCYSRDKAQIPCPFALSLSSCHCLSPLTHALLPAYFLFVSQTHQAYQGFTCCSAWKVLPADLHGSFHFNQISFQCRLLQEALTIP